MIWLFFFLSLLFIFFQVKENRKNIYKQLRETTPNKTSSREKIVYQPYIYKQPVVYPHTDAQIPSFNQTFPVPSNGNWEVSAGSKDFNYYPTITPKSKEVKITSKPRSLRKKKRLSSPKQKYCTPKKRSKKIHISPKKKSKKTKK